ncbi:uncharacterized protein LOC119094205 [Pollicipes pollicipes]|uniref:uncharacterized protein LOC119094205 n=1 Tax=Pollicipes pollicipes TaxID=41117 RepID=UPI001884DFB5|nr:uncharacterized protein LOC119094205 [Pollicipes pollicipes]
MGASGGVRALLEEVVSGPFVMGCVCHSLALCTGHSVNWVKMAQTNWLKVATIGSILERQLVRRKGDAGCSKFNNHRQ